MEIIFHILYFFLGALRFEIKRLCDRLPVGSLSSEHWASCSHLCASLGTNGPVVQY